MEITPAQFERLQLRLPKPRGGAQLTNLSVLNALLYVTTHRCTWRQLPAEFGNWHTVYVRLNRWSKAGLLDDVFYELQKSKVIQIKIEAAECHQPVRKQTKSGSRAPRSTNRKANAQHGGQRQEAFIWLPKLLVRT